MVEATWHTGKVPVKGHWAPECRFGHRLTEREVIVPDAAPKVWLTSFFRLVVRVVLQSFGRENIQGET